MALYGAPAMKPPNPLMHSKLPLQGVGAPNGLVGAPEGVPPMSPLGTLPANIPTIHDRNPIQGNPNLISPPIDTNFHHAGGGLPIQGVGAPASNPMQELQAFLTRMRGRGEGLPGRERRRGLGGGLEGLPEGVPGRSPLQDLIRALAG